MKKFLTLMFVWLPISLAAPSAAQMSISVNRSLAMAPGDANRDPYWDWTQNVSYTLNVTGVGLVNVPLPYYSSTGPAAADLNLSTGRDILPSDGWVLVVRDFGSVSSSTPLPYFILYNKHRGLLRLFYWSTLSSTFTRAIAELSFQQTASTATTAALFAFSGPNPEYVGSYNPKKAEIAIGKLEPHQWGYFDFDVSGYDPNLASRIDPTLVFRIAGVQESSIVLQGTIQTDSGSTTTHNGDAANGFKNIVNGAFAAYEKPAQRFKQIEDAQQKYTAMANANSNTWWGKYLQGIGTLGKTPWLKALGPVAGFVEAVLGFGSSSGGPLLINATVKLNGNMTTETALYSIILRTPGAIHADPTNDTAANTLPLYDRPLGIFNLLAPPVLTVTYDDRNYLCYVPFSEWYPGGPPQTAIEPCRKEATQRLARLDYVVNPDSGLTVDAIDAAYLPSNGALPDFYVAGTADGYLPLCTLQQTPVRTTYGGCPPPSLSYCPTPSYPLPEPVLRDIGLRVRLRISAAPAIEPALLLRKYKPTLGTATSSCPATGGCATCGEASCSPVQAAYISHFTGSNCTGDEHYYTPYFNTDGVRRSWNGTGCAGTQLRTVTNRSYRDSSGTCYNAWPSGNTLSGFVRIYR